MGYQIHCYYRCHHCINIMRRNSEARDSSSSSLYLCQGRPYLCFLIVWILTFLFKVVALVGPFP